MADNEKQNQPEDNNSQAPDESSLEQPSTKVEEDEHDVNALEKKSEPANQTAAQPTIEAGEQMSWREKVIRRMGGFNPYLVLFILVLFTGLLVAFIANRLNTQNNPASLTFEGSELDQEALDELLASEQNIGTVDQTLTVAANAIFEGKILVKSDLDVAGSIRVGGPLNLPGITVAGTSDFEDVNVSNNLTVVGSTSIQQSLTVQGGANISGNVSVGGTVSASLISADEVEFTGDLNLTRHIDTGGGTPQLVKGSALGSGGTASISGNDIAGTITINTGGGPPAGIFATINFRNGYNSTPHVQITPVGSAAGGIDYYVERSTSNFRIGTASAPPASTTMRFDYFIVE